LDYTVAHEIDDCPRILWDFEEIFERYVKRLGTDRVAERCGMRRRGTQRVMEMAL